MVVLISVDNIRYSIKNWRYYPENNFGAADDIWLEHQISGMSRIEGGRVEAPIDLSIGEHHESNVFSLYYRARS
jgi:hypothetical protein